MHKLTPKGEHHEQSNRTVVITGAWSGIGLALAEAYLKRGDNVVGKARSNDMLEVASAFLGRPVNSVGVAGDIAEPGTAAELFRVAWERFGTVDILINNVGIVICKPFASRAASDGGAAAGVW